MFPSHDDINKDPLSGVSLDPGSTKVRRIMRGSERCNTRFF